MRHRVTWSGVLKAYPWLSDSSAGCLVLIDGFLHTQVQLGADRKAEELKEALAARDKLKEELDTLQVTLSDKLKIE
jgi:hypothetical protein